MKRLICAWIILILCICPLTAAASGVSNSLSDFRYEVDEENRTVTLLQYTGSDTTVTVPGSYNIDGELYQVFIDTYYVFAENTNIVSVTFQSGVRPANNTCGYLFFKCSNLTYADLSGLDTTGVTDMTCLFSGCEKLSTIVGYENWDTGSVESIYMAFNMTRSLKTVDLSRWDLSSITNSGWCFQYCSANTIRLPDNLRTISAGFMNHAKNYTGSTFTLPAGVQQVGYGHTFYDFATSDFTEFIVPVENAYFVAREGILYSVDGSQLLAIPRNKTFKNGVFQIPEGVTFLGELSFSRNYNISTVILPDSFSIYYVEKNAPEYILFHDSGNLNSGSNLNIAIYSYTGITSYAVKETNPLYTSRNGIIYTKDMSSVVAIPSRYDQKIDIPEGVANWESAALWTAPSTDLLKNCSGVHIPSTLTDIADDQLKKINDLKGSVSGFSLSVHPENTAYCLDDNGLLSKHIFTDYTVDANGNKIAYCSRNCGVSHIVETPAEPAETIPTETEPVTPTEPVETTPEVIPAPQPTQDSSHLWFIPAGGGMITIFCILYCIWDMKKKR